MERKPIKLYLLSGFLGSGKTTFLKNILEHLQDKKVGIIMNEFGKVSIDGILVKKNGIDVLELNNGSIFCSCLKGSFVEGLITYANLPIDYLFVESSGLADPSNIESILDSVVKKMKDCRYDYKGAVCIVDAVYFLDHFDLFTSIEKQVAKSSIIIINKIDLVNHEKIKEIEKTIRQINFHAEIVKTSFCKFDLNFLERDLRTVHSIDMESSNTPENKPKTFVLKTEGIFDKVQMIDFLKSLTGYTFRMKGFFHLNEGWHQIDVVGNQINIKPTQLVQEISQLVIISNIGLPIVKKVFENWEKRFDEKMILR